MNIEEIKQLFNTLNLPNLPNLANFTKHYINKFNDITIATFNEYNINVTLIVKNTILIAGICGPSRYAEINVINRTTKNMWTWTFITKKYKEEYDKFLTNILHILYVI